MSLSGANDCVCLVIPCYNEASRLNIQGFRTFLASGSATRLLFVDDGSRDATHIVLEQLRHGYERCTEILRCNQNRGKAEAVRRGMLHVLDNYDTPLVGFWDADLATPLGTVAAFQRVLAEGPRLEMVFGSRVKLLGRQVERRAVRHYLGRIFATAVSVMLQLPIYDTQCGAKLFRVTRELRDVFSKPFISKWVFDVEILARYLQLYDGNTKRLEEAIYEYPLEAWIDVAGSKVRGKDFFTALIDIARIKLRYLR
ncbi:MAG TPA: glycosyltransferase [Bryobacteraceae bacterium]|jgi:glycosyltransferase involved in cell wall biosynthesis|nr:glycosyltransferase [Bryobacteraceae bacterium]